MTTSNQFVPNIGNPPSKDLFVDKDFSGEDINHRNWVQWTNAVSNHVNSPAFYGNPSEALNSDFYWQRGIATPITEGDGDGAFFAEKWQIQGAAVATYTITTTAYAADASNQEGSIYYENFNVTNYTGDGSSSDFYAYQQTQSLSAFLRRFQGRFVSMSAIIENNQNKAITARFELFFEYDGSTAERFMGDNFSLSPGNNQVSDQIETPFIEGKTIGAGCYVQFRFVICSLGDNTADFDLTYIKVEIANQATVLYVDHALEKTRIDNS